MVLPEFDERLDFQVAEFSYDRSNGSFVIKGSDVQVIEVSDLQTSPELLVNTLVENIDTMPLSAIGTGIASHGLYLVGTPKLDHLLTDNSYDQSRILNETQDCMREVYATVTGKVMPKKTRNSGYMGFNAELTRPGQPTLHTIGNCACLGVDYMGLMFEDDDWDSGYTSFQVHNIDSDVQWASLYAGIGYLSLEASNT